MASESLLSTLQQRGALLTAEGSTLYVEPCAVLTDVLRSAIRAAKPDLLRLLKWRDDPLGDAKQLTDGCAWLRPYLPTIESVLRGLVSMDSPLGQKQPHWLREDNGRAWVLQTVPRIVAMERNSRSVGLTSEDRKKLVIGFRVFAILERLALEVFND